MLWILKVRDPASRNCDLVRSKFKCPLPFGPPAATYVGISVDPIPGLLRVDTDANAGFHVIRATNLAQAVREYGEMKFALMNPLLHVQLTIDVLPAGEVEFAGHGVKGPPFEP